MRTYRSGSGYQNSSKKSRARIHLYYQQHHHHEDDDLYDHEEDDHAIIISMIIIVILIIQPRQAQFSCREPDYFWDSVQQQIS